MKSCNFWGFPKSGEEILKIYFTFKFFFSRENIFQEISSQILENPKNFMISFFHPLSFNGKNLWPNFHFRFFPRMFSFSQSVSFFPKIKHFFSPKQNEIFGTSSGRTQDVFPFFSRGRKSHRLNRQTIRDVLERGNKVYHRKADHKLFPHLQRRSHFGREN